MITLNQVFEPIKKELELVEDEIKKIPLAGEELYPLSIFLNKVKGKRIRPAIVLLSSKLNNNVGSSAVRLAAQMELIHTASLIHDDIIDKAEIRRGALTLNKKFGQDIALVLGDYLFSEVFEFFIKNNNPKVTKIILNIVKKICTGELKQLQSARNFNMSEKEYLDGIINKTASFFSACCEIGAIAGGVNESEIKCIRNYGLNFGIVFQILDDYIDILGYGDDEKKSLYTDLINQKITLPIIFLWQDLPSSKRRELFKSENGKISITNVRKIGLAFSQNGARSKTINAIKSYATKAKESISELENKKISSSLNLLVDFMLLKVKN